MMNARKIFEKLRHFYFNYHDNDTSSVLTSTAVIRHAQFALRMTISFLISGFLAYGTRLNNPSRLQYMVPAACVLSIQETFGMTLIGACIIVITIVPLSIFLFVIQKLGLGYQDYLAAELTLLISSLLISYKYSKIQVRKIPLVVNAIFFATIVNQKLLPSTFIFYIILQIIIGLIVSVGISLLICPLFATIDFENRVNYCLKNLHEMQTITIQAFVCQDEVSAKLAMTRASTIEQTIRTAMSLLPKRLIEAHLEPTRWLQQIYNRKRKHLFALTLSEQEDLINSLMFHVCSMLVMVQRCQFNEYHVHLAKELQRDLIHLVSCQSTVISGLLPRGAIDRDEFDRRLNELEHALESLRHVYLAGRLDRLENALGAETAIRSEDHFSHAFFLFQIGAIVRLLKKATIIRERTSIIQDLKNAWKTRRNKKRRSWKDLLKLQWPRFVSAFKSMLIIGVGSIFVMVPRLAEVFENGQWILMAVCLTQGDTVGGAFSSMKMRLVGTIFGSMWAYVVYLAVDDNIYAIFGMLVPWILVFGYLKSSSKWDFAAVVAAFTPVVINLGRLPYQDILPAGDYAILRIEENLVGMAIAIVLTIVIFPIFASDLLRSNIETTLQLCQQTTDAMRSIYTRLIHHENTNTSTSDNVERNDVPKVQSIVDAQRSSFHRVISLQHVLLIDASLEPTMCWSRNKFSPDLFRKLILQQVDIFQMLHNIDTILVRIDEVADGDENQIKNLQMHLTNALSFSDLRAELLELCQQLSDCLALWASYFSDTRTQFYRLYHDCSCRRTKLTADDLLKHERHLMELHETNYRLQSKHQQIANRLLERYLDQATQGESVLNMIPFVNNEKADGIFHGISALYFSIAQLARATLALGMSIHNIFELETTHLYRAF